VFVGELVWNLCKICLCIWNKQILGLRTIDRITKSPAADCFNTLAVSALSPLRGQTGAALTARRDRADQNAVADFVSGQSFAELFDHTNGFVSDYESRFNCVFAAQYVQVRAADGR